MVVHLLSSSAMFNERSKMSIIYKIEKYEYLESAQEKRSQVNVIAISDNMHDTISTM